MQVTQGASFAFHALMQMARSPEGSLTIDGMAQSLGASPTYMAKLFQRLARAGLVVSRRGRRGGYSLARPASTITLWEITLALQDGAVLETPLLPICANCALSANCPLHASMRSAVQKVEDVLQTVSVGGMAGVLARVESDGRKRRVARRSRRSGPAEARPIAGSSSRR